VTDEKGTSTMDLYINNNRAQNYMETSQTIQEVGGESWKGR